MSEVGENVGVNVGVLAEDELTGCAGAITGDEVLAVLGVEVGTGSGTPVILPRVPQNETILPKFMDPSPVVGSHPGAAWNPCVQHVPSAAHRLLPDTISLTNNFECWYRTGLAQPIDPLPLARRAALIFEKRPAIVGEEAEVPDTKYDPPPITTV